MMVRVFFTEEETIAERMSLKNPFFNDLGGGSTGRLAETRSFPHMKKI